MEVTEYDVDGECCGNKAKEGGITDFGKAAMTKNVK